MKIFDTIQTVIDLASKYKHIDVYEAAMSLRCELLELREECCALREENIRLNNELRFRQQLVRHGNAYYLKDDLEYQFPYCLTCFDVEGKLVSLLHDEVCAPGSTVLEPAFLCGHCRTKRSQKT